MHGSLSAAERTDAQGWQNKVKQKEKEAQEERRDFIVKLSAGIGMLVVVVVLIRLVYTTSSKVAVDALTPSAQAMKEAVRPIAENAHGMSADTSMVLAFFGLMFGIAGLLSYAWTATR